MLAVQELRDVTFAALFTYTVFCLYLLRTEKERILGNPLKAAGCAVVMSLMLQSRNNNAGIPFLILVILVSACVFLKNRRKYFRGAAVWAVSGIGSFLLIGGILSLIKALPLMVKTFAAAFRDYGKGDGSVLRTEQDLPITGALIGALAVCVFLWLYPGIHVNLVGAILILVFDGLVIFGGVRKISDVTTFLTPIMALIYLGFGLVILIMNITLIPQALWFIVKSAFTGDAVIGGVAGATMGIAIRRGVQRGVFSNEAGTGSSAMVHATAKVDVPVKQALYGIIEVFFDTFVICTFTALIVMVSGVWNSGVTDGTVLASTAFRQNLGGLGQVVIVISLILFCLSTVLGWYTYGESAFAFLFGTHRVKIYRVLHMVICALGALISVQLLWDAADVCNGLMAIPNLFSLILFGGIVVKDTKDFFADYDHTQSGGRAK
jgi:hypothetical protein